jgi:hypothetical protein
MDQESFKDKVDPIISSFSIEVQIIINIYNDIKRFGSRNQLSVDVRRCLSRLHIKWPVLGILLEELTDLIARKNMSEDMNKCVANVKRAILTMMDMSNPEYRERKSVEVITAEWEELDSIFPSSAEKLISSMKDVIDKKGDKKFVSPPDSSAPSGPGTLLDNDAEGKGSGMLDFVQNIDLSNLPLPQNLNFALKLPEISTESEPKTPAKPVTLIDSTPVSPSLSQLNLNLKKELPPQKPKGQDQVNNLDGTLRPATLMDDSNPGSPKHSHKDLISELVSKVQNQPEDNLSPKMGKSILDNIFDSIDLQPVPPPEPKLNSISKSRSFHPVVLKEANDNIMDEIAEKLGISKDVSVIQVLSEVGHSENDDSDKNLFESIAEKFSNKKVTGVPEFSPRSRQSSFSKGKDPILKPSLHEGIPIENKKKDQGMFNNQMDNIYQDQKVKPDPRSSDSLINRPKEVKSVMEKKDTLLEDKDPDGWKTLPVNQGSEIMPNIVTDKRISGNLSLSINKMSSSTESQTQSPTDIQSKKLLKSIASGRMENPPEYVFNYALPKRNDPSQAAADDDDLTGSKKMKNVLSPTPSFSRLPPSDVYRGNGSNSMVTKPTATTSAQRSNQNSWDNMPHRPMDDGRKVFSSSSRNSFPQQIQSQLSQAQPYQLNPQIQSSSQSQNYQINSQIQGQYQGGINIHPNSYVLPTQAENIRFLNFLPPRCFVPEIYLQVLNGTQHLNRVPEDSPFIYLDLSTPVRVGRCNNDDFPNFYCLSNSQVISRKHIEFFFDQNENCFFIQDVGSHGGTWLNDNRLSEPGCKSNCYEVETGDIIRLGHDMGKHPNDLMFKSVVARIFCRTPINNGIDKFKALTGLTNYRQSKHEQDNETYVIDYHFDLQPEAPRQVNQRRNENMYSDDYGTSRLSNRRNNENSIDKSRLPVQNRSYDNDLQSFSSRKNDRNGDPDSQRIKNNLEIGEQQKVYDNRKFDMIDQDHGRYIQDVVSRRPEVTPDLEYIKYNQDYDRNQSGINRRQEMIGDEYNRYDQEFSERIPGRRMEIQGDEIGRYGQDFRRPDLSGEPDFSRYRGDKNFEIEYKVNTDNLGRRTDKSQEIDSPRFRGQRNFEQPYQNSQNEGEYRMRQIEELNRSPFTSGNRRPEMGGDNYKGFESPNRVPPDVDPRQNYGRKQDIDPRGYERSQDVDPRMAFRRPQGRIENVENSSRYREYEQQNYSNAYGRRPHDNGPEIDYRDRNWEPEYNYSSYRRQDEVNPQIRYEKGREIDLRRDRSVENENIGNMKNSPNVMKGNIQMNPAIYTNESPYQSERIPDQSYNRGKISQ